MYPFDEAKSRVQSLEMREDSLRESNRKKPRKGSAASLDSVQRGVRHCCEIRAGFEPERGIDGPSASSVAVGAHGPTEKLVVKVWDGEKERPLRFDLGSPAPALGACPPTRGPCHLPPSTTDDGLEVSIDNVYPTPDFYSR